MSHPDTPNYRPMIDALMILAALMALILGAIVIGRNDDPKPEPTPPGCNCRPGQPVIPHLPTGDLN